MIDGRRAVAVAWRAGAVAAAFALGVGGARLLGGWRAYHERPVIGGVCSTASRAVVERVVGESDGTLRLQARLLTGEHRGRTVPAAQAVRHLRGRGWARAGDRCVVFVARADGELRATVSALEREGVLLGLVAALAVLLALTSGRKGLATIGAVLWAVVLLVGLLLPGVLSGARAGLWCVPLAVAIAVPTLLAIGGWNRKSVAAVGGTLCGTVAGGLLALGFVRAMQMTGLDVEFGPYHHMDNRLWFAEGLHRVRFGSLLVGGMLLAGLGAVMDVSMAVASTVAEVGRAAPRARGWALVRPGLAAGRDILGVMVLTVAMVYVGSHLMFLVSVGQTGWAERWLLLANYEEVAAELARVAAAALGMAVCVPATAWLAALLHRAPRAAGEGAP